MSKYHTPIIRIITLIVIQTFCITQLGIAAPEKMGTVPDSGDCPHFFHSQSSLQNLRELSVGERPADAAGLARALGAPAPVSKGVPAAGAFANAAAEDNSRLRQLLRGWTSANGALKHYKGLADEHKYFLRGEFSKRFNRRPLVHPLIKDDNMNQFLYAAEQLSNRYPNDRIISIGRSPQWLVEAARMIDIYKHPDRALDRYALVAFSGRWYGLDDADMALIQNVTLRPNPQQIANYRQYLSHKGLAPDSIVNQNGRVVLVDSIETGASMRSFLDILEDWAEEIGPDMQARFKDKIIIHSLGEPEFMQVSKTAFAGFTVNTQAVADELITIFRVSPSESYNASLAPYYPYSSWNNFSPSYNLPTNARLLYFRIIDYLVQSSAPADSGLANAAGTAKAQSVGEAAISKSASQAGRAGFSGQTQEGVDDAEQVRRWREELSAGGWKSSLRPLKEWLESFQAASLNLRDPAFELSIYNKLREGMVVERILKDKPQGYTIDGEGPELAIIREGIRGVISNVVIDCGIITRNNPAIEEYMRQRIPPNLPLEEVENRLQGQAKNIAEAMIRVGLDRAQKMVLLMLATQQNGEPPLSVKKTEAELRKMLRIKQEGGESREADANVLTFDGRYHIAVIYKPACNVSGFRFGGDGFIVKRVAKDIVLALFFDITGHSFWSAFFKAAFFRRLNAEIEDRIDAMKQAVVSGKKQIDGEMIKAALKEAAYSLHEYTESLFRFIGEDEMFIVLEATVIDYGNKKLYHQVCGEDSLRVIYEKNGARLGAKMVNANEAIGALEEEVVINPILGVSQFKRVVYLPEEISLGGQPVAYVVSDGGIEGAAIEEKDGTLSSLTAELFLEMIEKRAHYWDAAPQRIARDIISAIQDVRHSRDDVIFIAAELPYAPNWCLRDNVIKIPQYTKGKFAGRKYFAFVVDPIEKRRGHSLSQLQESGHFDYVAGLAEMDMGFIAEQLSSNGARDDDFKVIIDRKESRISFYFDSLTPPHIISIDCDISKIYREVENFLESI